MKATYNFVKQKFNNSLFNDDRTLGVWLNQRKIGEVSASRLFGM